MNSHQTRESFSRSTDAWIDRASKVMPGLNSNFRWGGGVEPHVFERANGLRYYDPDGRDYIDYVLGMGPAIWGHSNSQYIDAIHGQLDDLFSCGSAVAHSTTEILLAEKIVKYVPCAEKVRFGISGSEADQLAMRLARSQTGKQYILRFEGHYHGWLDPVFCGRSAPESDKLPFPVPADGDSSGMASHVYQDTLIIPWNDTERLERTLARFGDKIALVMMEAVMCNNSCCPPRLGYLESVRELCNQHQVLLAFDEVITGFRVGLDGAQGHFGVIPDLAIFAKALAGGMPLSVVAGKAEVMNTLAENRVLGGGTFNTFPLAMAGGLVSLDMLSKNNGEYYQKVDRCQIQLVDGIKQIADNHGHKLLIQGIRGMIYLGFTDLQVAWTPAELVSSDFDKQQRFRTLLHAQGVIIGGGSRMVISGELTDKDIADTLERVDRSMSKL